MPLEPFLRRELITSVRRRTVFSERCSSVLLMSAIVAGCVVTWDWSGWDRASVAGATSFALSTFGLIVAVQAILVLGLVATLIAPAIASERDRKSLDSLLATRVSAADIVLGTMVAGLLRYTNHLAALVPVVMLMVSLAGIDPRLILLAGAGLASTAFALAALAVAVSAGARTAAQATSTTLVLAMSWIFLPFLIVMLLPRAWPAAALWVVPIAVRVFDSTPLGVALSLLGVIPRGPMVSAVLRMIALQASAAVTFVLWAIARLRPASRAIYDVEGRNAFRRLLRVRWRPRPACGDDPVFWHEIYSARATNNALTVVDRIFNLFWLGLFAYATSVFAVPAFAELSQLGYGAVPGHSAIPELHPIARVLVNKLTKTSIALTPGQARLEFNIVLRQTTGLLNFVYILMVAGVAAESVAAERERETWLGLITTPLSGREILRAKMLGSIWKTRVLACLMLALWVVGLLAGAVHPLGFLAALVGLVVTSGFLAAVGVSVSLWSRDRSQATGRILGPLMLCQGLSALPFLWPGMGSTLLGAGTMPFLAWASLLSYEDVHAAIHSGVLPQFAVIGIHSGAGAWIILAAWLISTAAQAVGAFLVTRAAFRGFDAAVGRPIRSRGNAHRGGTQPDPCAG